MFLSWLMSCIAGIDKIFPYAYTLYLDWLKPNNRHSQEQHPPVRVGQDHHT
jgi:hypothetical protein